MTVHGITGAPGAVFELNPDGTSRLLYAAGSPEAEEFHRTYGDPDNPVALEPATPDPELPNPPDEAVTGDIGISEPDPVPDDTEETP